MNEIPDDIMAAAERTHTMIMANPSTEATAILRIARAITAERQRCLRLTEEEQRKADVFNGAYDGLACAMDRIRDGQAPA